MHERITDETVIAGQAHGLNLLIRDIINLPLIKKVLGKCMKIIKFFTQKQLPRQWLKKVQLEKGGKEIALIKSVETRWGSHLASFESILKNREYLQTLAVTQDFKDHIKPRLLNTILYDKRFWKRVESNLNLLNTPSSILNNMECDTPSSLSYMYSNFENIYINIITNYEFLSRSEQETLLGCFKHRKDFMFHDS
jgi:hypothetical protein